MKNSKKVALFVDWKNLSKAKKISDFEIEMMEHKDQSASTNKTGVRIEIEDLKVNWSDSQIREVYRALTSLNSPFDENEESFDVIVTSDDPEMFKGLPTFDEIKDSALYYGRCVMRDSKIVEFEYEFKPWSSLTKIDKGRKVPMKRLSKSELNIIDMTKEMNPINLKDHLIGPIEFEIIIFEKDTQIFNYVNVEKASIKRYLNDNGGIRVYRDGIRVYDYGERDNDWLGIDLKRVSRVGGRVSNNIIIGSVKISRSKSKGLEEKTNREGFIENDSYNAFVNAVDYALSIFVRERNIDKQTLTTLYKNYKVIEPVLSDLDEVVRIVEDKIKSGQTKTDLMQYLSRIGTQYKDVKEILIKSANAGLNFSIVIHEVEKLIAQLTGCIEREELDKAINISKMLEKIVRGFTGMIKKSSIGNTKLSDIAAKAIENYEFRFSDHKIKIFSNYEEINLKAYLAESESISVLTNLLDNAIYWLSYARKADRKISVFVTDKIEGYNSIVVSDNGPGFNIPIDMAIEPFITGKPHNIGSGLGLHIADEMMKALKGKLIFLEEDDIKLPKNVISNKINKSIIALCFSTKKK